MEKINDKYQDMIEHCISESRKNLNDKNGLFPMAYLHTERGFNIYALDLQDEAAKRMSFGVVRKKAHEENADFMMSVIESWTIPEEYAHDFMNNRARYPNVYDYPKRVDCVMFYVEIQEAIWIGKSLVTGPEGNRVMGEPEFKKMDPSEVSGKAAKFLKR